jgi:oligopeptide/dipeptide ABC transporter ATP-binding protein
MTPGRGLGAPPEGPRRPSSLAGGPGPAGADGPGPGGPGPGGPGPGGEAPVGDALLSADGLHVTFPAGRGRRVTAVEDVSLAVSAGETLGIVGESGCGKSTVARCLVGLLVPGAGTVSLAGKPLGARRSRQERRSVQLVFQDPYSSLNPRLSVRSVLTELINTTGQKDSGMVDERCRELMNLVGLPADALERYPSSFSGGQRQRVAIARALAVEPEVIVADEPISALDVSVQAAILALFADLSLRLRIGIVLISHNLAAVRQVCDRVAVMYLGRVVEIGGRDEIFEDPRHPYTKALLAAAPRIAARRQGNQGQRDDLRLKGEPPGATVRPSGCPFHPRCPRAEPICAELLPELLSAPAGSERLAACHFREETT